MRTPSAAPKPYKAFGEDLQERRQKAGISQDDFARRIGKSQQTLSRWEAGFARPKEADIRRIAALLAQDIGDEEAAGTARISAAESMLRAAGYRNDDAIIEQTSFDKPLPLEGLMSETFERFVMTMVDGLYPGAAVNKAGSTGHDQDGLDLIATLADGKRISFQCKRVKTFGPAEVKRAVEAHSASADRKVLVLSRTVSPKAYEELKKHEGWEVWDKEVLSMKLRSLSNERQNTIVDTFFPGRRYELLGRHEPGPWLELQKFFEPFEARDAAFSHEWPLQARSDDLEAVSGMLEEATLRVGIVAAPGGVGKSRLLKEAVKAYQDAHPEVLVRFLSPTTSPKPEDFEALRSGPKLIVVDDAHDREDLMQVFEYAAKSASDARVLLASRPYGVDRVKGGAASFALHEPRTHEIQPLGKEALVALAREVLVEFEAEPSWADHIVNIAKGNPLIAVMAARVMAKERVPPALASAQETLRNVIIGKFEKVMVGGLGSPSDQDKIARLLELIGLLQPFDPTDPYFIGMCDAVVGLDEITTSRLTRLLVDGGIIYRRGRLYRLMPDVLGDFLIDRSCVTPEGQLTAFAKKVFAAAQDRQISRVFVNLGRLDWRRNEGDPTDSALLTGLWRSLDDIRFEYDPRLDAAFEAAAYQPRRALEFVERHLQAGRQFREFPKILRRIAISDEGFEEACELLWELGKDDQRATGPHPDHPLRILSGLTEPEAHKPFAISKKAFRFGMDLIKRPGAWDSFYSPLDVVSPMLRGDGLTTTSKVTHFEMKPFLVRYDLVEPLRQELIDRLLELMRGSDPVAGQKAAALLEAALRRPMGTMGQAVPDELLALYTIEFERTLSRVLDEVKKGGLHPAVLVAIARAVSWHANYNNGRVRKLAKAVIDNLPDDLFFRTCASLMDGYGQVFMGKWKTEDWDKRVTEWIGRLVADLNANFNDPEALRAYIGDALSSLAVAGVESSSAHVLVIQLIRNNPPLARAFVDDANTNPDSPTARLAASGITELLTSCPDEGRARVLEMLGSEVRQTKLLAAQAFGGMARSPEAADYPVLRKIVSDDDPAVVASGLRSALGWQKQDPAPLLAIARAANLGTSERAADDLCMILRGSGKALLDAMDRPDAEALLAKFLPIPKLEGHWVDEVLAYLSEHHALETAEFFFARVERFSTETEFNSSRPVNHGPWSQVKLQFRKSPHVVEVLRRTWEWLKRHEAADECFLYNARNLFQAMFGNIDGEVVSLLSERVENGSSEDLKLIARLLREAPPPFVFNQRGFVVAFLEKCRSVSDDLLQLATQSLQISATSGVRGGVVGQPAPEDVKMKADAEEAMKKVSRLSPAFRLYKDIAEYGAWSMKFRLDDLIEDDW